MGNAPAIDGLANRQVGWKTKFTVFVAFTGVMIVILKDTYSAKQEAGIGNLPKEIDPSEIEVEKKIKSGSFGDVHEGRYCPVEQSNCSKVAIKTLREEFDEKARQDLMEEASIMAQLDHPNIVKLIGVVTKANPPMIIMEYMKNGTLHELIEHNDLGLRGLVSGTMLRDIARAMVYLAEKGYVHRDLAARNILIDDQSRCKISDFGLSRKMDKKDDGTAVFTSTQPQDLEKLPIDWMAPEAIMNGEYTSASDVWSFGVVIWQLTNRGRTPTSELSHRGKIVETLTGIHQSVSGQFSDFFVWKIWNMDRKDRPTFEKIVFEFDKMLSRLEWIKQLYP